MKFVVASAMVLALAGCASSVPALPTVSTLVDLDPTSVDRTVIVESITADRLGRLYVADRVTGNVLRVDPVAPKPEVVARIEVRDVQGKRVNADPSGLAFDAQGNLYLAAGPFAEVLRVSATDLNPAKPGLAQTWATGTPGANGIAFDQMGNLFVSGGASGTIYRIASAGGAAQVAIQIEKFVRTLPDGKTRQPIVANGVAFDAAGVLHVLDSARGAVWKVPQSPNAQTAVPVLLTESTLLEGADGLAFDHRGDAWVAVNELNAVVAINPAGIVRTVARNTSAGPLEFPSAVVFVGQRAYITNFDVPRRDNLDASGTTSRDGVGASIVVMAP